MTGNDFVKEIHNVELLLERFMPHYWDKEKETDSELKLIMLLNNWGSPVIACEELLKRIDSNEQIIRRNLHIKFSELGYKSRYSELREKLCIEKNHGIYKKIDVEK